MSDAIDDDELDDEVAPKPFWRRRKFQLLLAGSFLGLAWLWSHGAQPPPKPDQQKLAESFIGAVVPYQAPGTNPLPTHKAEAPPPPIPAPQPPAPVPTPAALPVATNPLANLTPPTLMPRFPMPAQPAAKQIDHRPAVLSYAVHIDPPKPSATPAAAPAETGLAFKTAALPGMKASPAIDETYMLAPGLLPLVLDTAIDSNNSGPILAHLPGPVYSPKGVLLMEAGTQIIGKYETMTNNGSRRLRAFSTYAHTPNGVWVPLAGEPFADELGRSGLPGAVNNHYVERFGGAVLLNLTDAALGILQAEVSKGGNTYLSLNNGGGVSSLAQSVLQQTINMPATFSKNQGETIVLFIDQPIDFSGSYRIRSIR